MKARGTVIRGGAFWALLIVWTGFFFLLGVVVG